MRSNTITKWGMVGHEVSTLFVAAGTFLKDRLLLVVRNCVQSGDQKRLIDVNDKHFVLLSSFKLKLNLLVLV
jgi:hypothetical protein